ncbi:MAG: hypothetical protein L0312_33235, partial [Acidobacteria bacterium]|nr:hypothetical protein [Acidobacteriota bacterium]
KKPPPLSRKCPEIPIRVEEVILRALEKAPDKRPQSTAQLVEQLEAAYLDATRQRGKDWWKSLALGLPLLLLILLLMFVIKEAMRAPGPASPTPEVKKSPAGLLRYAVFRQAADGPSQMLDGNQVYEGDKVHFEFTLPFPGAVYLLFKGKDGALVWVNPKAGGLPQAGSAGQGLRAPEKDGINMGEEPGFQEYLAVYVPVTNQWSLLDLINPRELNLRQPVRRANFQHAFISSEAASRFAAYLDKNAYRLTFPIHQTRGEGASLTLTPDMREKILFHTITLKQAPRN